MHDTQTRQQYQEAAALANAAEHKGSPVGVTLGRALAQNASGWVRDVLELENAKFAFSTGHYEQAIRICEQLVESEPEPTAWRGRALRMLAAATMAQPSLDEAQIDQVQEWLDEALSIFQANRDPYQIGQVLREQGTLAYWRGNVEEGSEQISIGEKLESSFSKYPTAAESRSRQVVTNGAGQQGPRS